MRMAMLRSASLSSRSRMTRLCTLSPSWPANGPSLMRKVIDSVGGSTGCAGSGVSTGEIAQRVGDGRLAHAGQRDDLAGLARSRPAARSRPRKASTFWARNCSTTLPSPCSALTVWLGLTLPEVMRPVRMRPEIGVGLQRGRQHAERARRSTVGGGTCARPGRTAAPGRPSGPAGSSAIQPSRPEP